MATGAALRASAHLPREETERGHGGEQAHSREELPLNDSCFSSPSRIHLVSSPPRAAAETLSAPNLQTGTKTGASFLLSSPNRLLSLELLKQKMKIKISLSQLEGAYSRSQDHPENS